MNLAQQLAKKSMEVTNRDKLDIIFNEELLPMINRKVDLKQRELKLSSFSLDERDRRVKELFPDVSSLQSLVETEMYPYLIELGFKIGICSPNYYVYIRW